MAKTVEHTMVLGVIYTDLQGFVGIYRGFQAEV